MVLVRYKDHNTLKGAMQIVVLFNLQGTLSISTNHTSRSKPEAIAMMVRRRDTDGMKTTLM